MFWVIIDSIIIVTTNSTKRVTYRNDFKIFRGENFDPVFCIRPTIYVTLIFGLPLDTGTSCRIWCGARQFPPPAPAWARGRRHDQPSRTGRCAPPTSIPSSLPGHTCPHKHYVSSSVADPDPHDFGPPGSGSTSQRYGSGSGYFYYQSKIVKKTLIPTPCDFC